MSVCAIDVGTRNLALVTGSVIDKKLKISFFRLIDLKTGPLKRIVTALKSELDKIDFKQCVDVLIEQQNRMNPRAQSLSHSLQMYFLMKEIDVSFVSPVSKFNNFLDMGIITALEAGRGNKAKRKKTAVFLLKHLN